MLNQLEGEVNERDRILCTVRLSGVLERDKRDGFKAIARQLCEVMEVKFVHHVSAQQNIKFFKMALAKLYASAHNLLSACGIGV